MIVSGAAQLHLANTQNPVVSVCMPALLPSLYPPPPTPATTTTTTHSLPYRLVQTVHS